jgi:hypothetical protein
MDWQKKKDMGQIQASPCATRMDAQGPAENSDLR